MSSSVLQLRVLRLREARELTQDRSGTAISAVTKHKTLYEENSKRLTSAHFLTPRPCAQPLHELIHVSLMTVCEGDDIISFT